MGAGWVDGENEIYGLDLRQFLPVFYIYGRSYKDFMCYNPRNIHKNEDGTADLITDGFRFKCTFEGEQPVYAQIIKLLNRNR